MIDPRDIGAVDLFYCVLALLMVLSAIAAFAN